MGQAKAAAWRWRAAGLGGLLAAGPSVRAGPAAAHGALPGEGGFLTGALHPLVAVEHLILLAALGLLSGRLPPERRGAGFGALAGGLAAGLLLRRAGVEAGPAPAAILVLAVLSGGLVALAPSRLPAGAGPALSLLAGLAVGLDTDVAAPEDLGWGLAALLAGVATGVFLVVLDAAALAALAVRPPVRVAVRVAGSWIAAGALLLLARALGRG